MADKRYYAKMDVGYYSNPKWYRLERIMRVAMPTALPDALRAAVRTAQAAHSASIFYCREHLEDGIFPVDAIKRELGIMSDLEEAAITALFETGMWINHPLGMAEIRDYLEHQEPARKTLKRAEDAVLAAEARWSKNASGNATGIASGIAKGNANGNAQERRGEESNSSLSEVADATPRRDDVNELLDYLDDALAANEVKLPKRTKKNLDAMRLLLDKDGRTPEQVRRAIDYAARDTFWRANILSAAKLREKYDQLRLNAQRASKASPQAPTYTPVPEVGTPEWEERYGSH